MHNVHVVLSSPVPGVLYLALFVAAMMVPLFVSLTVCAAVARHNSH